MNLALPVLMLVTEPCERLGPIVGEAVAGGVNLVQLRDRTSSAASLPGVIARLREVVAARAEARLVVNGTWNDGETSLADGAHLPDGGISLSDARGGVPPDRLLGASVHSVEGARRAVDGGADYLVAGTIFPSRSHPGREPAGLGYLEAVCEAARSVLVLAIGGITPERTRRCIDAGAAGVAVLSAIMHSPDPRAAAAAFMKELSHD